MSRTKWIHHKKNINKNKNRKPTKHYKAEWVYHYGEPVVRYAGFNSTNPIETPCVPQRTPQEALQWFLDGNTAHVRHYVPIWYPGDTRTWDFILTGEIWFTDNGYQANSNFQRIEDGSVSASGVIFARAQRNHFTP